MLERNEINEYIFSLYDKGVMAGYAPDHLLIRALYDDSSVFYKYLNVLSAVTTDANTSFAWTFIANLSIKLKGCADFFENGHKHIEAFVKNQLAAGKSQYCERAVFEALSEINILVYLIMCFKGKAKEAIYEPQQNSGGANPEARFILEDGTIVNVEVKKGNFPKIVSVDPNTVGVVKPNIPLNIKQSSELEEFCKKNNIHLLYPSVAKMGDFIASAGKKFSSSASHNYYNILFLNWTYTNFQDYWANEPVCFFINPINGFFQNHNALPLVTNRKGKEIISKSDIDKLSAVIIYKDPLETILFTDFRYTFQRPSYRYLVNLKNKLLDFNKLSTLLHMSPYNTTALYEWSPIDYSLTITEELIDKVEEIILRI